MEDIARSRIRAAQRRHRTELCRSRTGELLVRWLDRGRTVVRVPGLRWVYLLGPEANALIFGHDEWFRAREAFAALEIVDGPTSVVLSDGEDHARRRRLIRPILAPRRIDGYVQTMVETADEALEAVRPGVGFDAYALLRSTIRRSTLRVLFGDDLASHADALGRTLQPLLDLVDKQSPLLTWHRRLNSRTWRRAMAARATIDDFVNERIQQVRAATPDAGTGPDAGGRSDAVLPLLVHGRDGQGSGLDDQEIRDQVVTMIAAGYETTGAAMGWIVYLLGRHPDWQRRVRDEVDAELAGRPPTAAALERLSLVRGVVMEALRMYPPAMISARFAVDGFAYRGHRVRPGDLIIFSPYATHRSHTVYSDPTIFDPGRWVETPKRAADEFIPFGGGKHRCPGSGLATTELTVLTARLLARGPFTLDAAPTSARGYAAMRPHPGVMITMA